MQKYSKGVDRMAYTEQSKKATMKYIKEKTKIINLKFRTEEYEQNIYPVIKKTGLPVATYIKQAIIEKIERDNNK